METVLDRRHGLPDDVRRERVTRDFPRRIGDDLASWQLVGCDQSTHGRRTDTKMARGFLEGKVFARLVDVVCGDAETITRRADAAFIPGIAPDPSADRAD